MKKIPVALVAALVTVGLSACGGGDDKKDGGDGLAKAELVKQANAICKATNDASDKIKAPTDINDPAQAAPYFKSLAELGHKLDDQLKALKPATEVKADYDAFLAEEKKAVDLVQGLADAAAAKDAKKGQQLLQEANANTSFKASADKLGLGTCV